METRSTAAGPAITGLHGTHKAAARLTIWSFVRLAIALPLFFSCAGLAWAGPIDDAKAAQARGDYAVAERIYRNLADQGNVVALTQIGIMYRTGRGLPRDDKQAFHWLRRAAALGSPQAQFSVGDMYLRGNGTAQDLLQAAKWYNRAAEQGHPQAQYALGILYKLGGGVRKSNQRAARWFKRSADQGLSEAQYELGTLYVSGQGVLRDYVIAFMWLTLARGSGSSSRTRIAAIDALKRLEGRMPPGQIAAAREQARAWRPRHEGSSEQ